MFRFAAAWPLRASIEGRILGCAIHTTLRGDCARISAKFKQGGESRALHEWRFDNLDPCPLSDASMAACGFDLIARVMVKTTGWRVERPSASSSSAINARVRTSRVVLHRLLDLPPCSDAII